MKQQCATAYALCPFFPDENLDSAEPIAMCVRLDPAAQVQLADAVATMDRRGFTKIVTQLGTDAVTLVKVLAIKEDGTIGDIPGVPSDDGAALIDFGEGEWYVGEENIVAGSVCEGFNDPNRPIAGLNACLFKLGSELRIDFQVTLGETRLNSYSWTLRQFQDRLGAAPAAAALFGHEERMVVLSTCHLTVETLQSLARHITCYDNEYGAFIYLGNEEVQQTGAMPSDLATLVTECRKGGFVWLKLARDAEVVERLPHYEHEEAPEPA